MDEALTTRLCRALNSIEHDALYLGCAQMQEGMQAHVACIKQQEKAPSSPSGSTSQHAAGNYKDTVQQPASGGANSGKHAGPGNFWGR